MSKLVLFLADGSTLDVPLDRERITIGRRGNNDVCLPNLAVSGEHAVVVTILADSFLEDMNSTNGTLVNGDAIAKHFLRDRDEIDIGRHRLVYCVDDEEKPPSKLLEGMARIQERDFGGRVETAKPFVQGRDSEPPPAAPAGKRGTAASGRVARSRETLVDLPVAEPPAPEPATPVEPPPTPPITGPAVRILTGVRAGTAVALEKAETTIGRPGIQVAAIVLADGSFRVRPLEGISPPTVNDQAIGADGAALRVGDVIEIAGTRVELIDPSAGQNSRPGPDLALGTAASPEP